MISLQKCVGVARVASRSIQQQKRSLISTPPTVKVSFAEKMLGAVALTVSFLGIPTYVALNIKNYKKS